MYNDASRLWDSQTIAKKCIKMPQGINIFLRTLARDNSNQLYLVLSFFSFFSFLSFFNFIFLSTVKIEQENLCSSISQISEKLADQKNVPL